MPSISSQDEVALMRMLFCTVRLSRDIAQLTPGRIIRLLRKRLRMSQSELGRLSGLRQAQISGIETGRVDTKLSILNRVLEVMNSKPLILVKTGIKFDEECARREKELDP